jgi:hypothetical protein
VRKLWEYWQLALTRFYLGVEHKGWNLRDGHGRSGLAGGGEEFVAITLIGEDVVTETSTGSTYRHDEHRTFSRESL